LRAGGVGGEGSDERESRDDCRKSWAHAVSYASEP
jgi:hypothetical protein